jgi:hypothetical protein
MFSDRLSLSEKRIDIKASPAVIKSEGKLSKLGVVSSKSSSLKLKLEEDTVEPTEKYEEDIDEVGGEIGVRR